MTYKYFEVRQEVYNKCSDKALKKNLSFDEMKKLYNKRYWWMLTALIGLIIATCLLIFFIPKKPYYVISIPLALFELIVLEVSREKIYNPEERKRERAEYKEVYEQYIQNLKSTLAFCGIDSASKRKVLKNECKARLEKQSKPYNSININAYNIFIGVPIGAIVSAIIYENNGRVDFTQVTGLIILGLFFIVISKAFKKLVYYVDGRFKDSYLLEVLNELEYTEDEYPISLFISP